MPSDCRPVRNLVHPDIPIEYQHHLKLLWHHERITQFLQGKMYDIHPVTAEIVPSLECNYGCTHCTYAGWKEHTLTTKGKRIMSEKTLYTALEKLYAFGIRGVIFTGGGEPFTNKITPKGIAYSKNIGLEVGIFTNGSLLTPTSIETVVENASFLRISLNAITNETYTRFHSIHNPQFLERVKRNIAYLATAVKGKDMKFGIGVIVNEINKDDLENIAHFIARTITRTNGRIDYVGIRPVIHYKERTTQISPQVVAAVLLAKPNIERILTEVGTQTFFATDYFEDVIETEKTGNKKYTRCLANPWAVSIAYDGGVYLCSEHDGDPEFLLGNITSSTMEEMWESEQRKKIIGNVGDCTAPTCKLHRLNKILNDWNTQGFGGDAPVTESQLHETHEIIDDIAKQGEPGGKNFL